MAKTAADLDIDAAFGTFDYDESGNDAADVESYDPFDIGTESPKKTSKMQMVPKETVVPKQTKIMSNVTLPPKLKVNFKVHEEISSVAKVDSELEGSSEVTVQGTVMAQVMSSDAIKNAPFIFMGSVKARDEPVDIIPNETYTKTYETRGDTKTVNVIRIPKTAVEYVPIGRYAFTETIEHMPLLLERRVTRKGTKVQVAIQVRSKLSNVDSIRDLIITLALADPIIEETLEVNAGGGEFEKMKRVVTWKLPLLKRGDSYMVSARALLAENTKDADLKFPVMLRCNSRDQISTGEFKAMEANGYPATVSSTVEYKTYRMIHRLK